MKKAIDFTIKNLDLRIRKVSINLEWNNMCLTNSSKQDQIPEIKATIAKLGETLRGYKLAKITLESNGEITPEIAKYIIKSLKTRNRILNENLQFCNDTIAHEKRALITKEGSRMETPIGGVTMVHYDDVSKSIIASCEKRVKKITNSLELCDKALKFFGTYEKVGV